jgi:hypothetical protein
VPCAVPSSGGTSSAAPHSPPPPAVLSQDGSVVAVDVRCSPPPYPRDHPAESIHRASLARCPPPTSWC